MPELGSDPQYLQMYMWDTSNEVNYRLNAIPGADIDPTIIWSLKNMLDVNNLYATHLRQISEIPHQHVANLSLFIRTDIPGLDQGIHNAFTTSQIAAIWINENVPPNVKQKCDIVLRTKMNELI